MILCHKHWIAMFPQSFLKIDFDWHVMQLSPDKRDNNLPKELSF